MPVKRNARSTFLAFFGKYFGKIFWAKKRLEKVLKAKCIRDLPSMNPGLLELLARRVNHQV
jgi:hypothetical protein